jgi:hypothetical protein
VQGLGYANDNDMTNLVDLGVATEIVIG